MTVSPPPPPIFIHLKTQVGLFSVQSTSAIVSSEDLKFHVLGGGKVTWIRGRGKPLNNTEKKNLTLKTQF